jgi:hypothetical protein
MFRQPVDLRVCIRKWDGQDDQTADQVEDLVTDLEAGWTRC